MWLSVPVMILQSAFMRWRIATARTSRQWSSTLTRIRSLEPHRSSWKGNSFTVVLW